MNNSSSSIVRFESVTYFYDHVPALERVSFTINRGTDTVLFGGNGAGKSTLLSLVAGVMKVSQGTIMRHFDGSPAYVLQSSLANSMLPLSVYECVTMGRWAGKKPLQRLSKYDRNMVREAIELLDLEALQHKQLSEISGGQRQRALLAQGVAQGAELLLLDEPATGLDIEAEQAIAEVIRSLIKNGTTVIQASHNLSVAKNADQVLLLKEGTLIAHGGPEAVLTPEQLTELF